MSVEYNFNFLLLFLFYGGVFSFALCLGQVLIRPKKNGNYLLILFFLIVSFKLLFYSLHEGGIINPYSLVLQFFLIFSQMLLGPLMYFIFKYFFVSRELKLQHLSDHIIKIFTVVVVCFMFLLLVDSEDVSFVKILIFFDYFARLIFNIYYILIFKLIFTVYKKVINPQKTFYAPLLIVLFLSFINHIIVSISAFYGYFYIGIYLAFASLFLFIAYIYSGRHPEFLLIPQGTEQKTLQRSHLVGMDVDATILVIHEVMCNEKIYREMDLNLPKFAAIVGINVHQLSEIINKRLNTTFYELLNVYRIHEACHYLTAENKKNIRAIAEMVGFKSLSSFYSAFKVNTGLTPTEYRSSHK